MFYFAMIYYFLALISLCWQLPLFAQNNDFEFENISIESGLSHYGVNCILQDSRGFIWIGTDNGLNRYDGRDFKIFKNDPMDSSSLSASYVECLYEDKHHALWVGTENGLNRFDRHSETFSRFLPIPGDTTSLSGYSIADIYETSGDSVDALWIATRSGVRDSIGGLSRFDPVSETFTRYLYDAENPNSISDNALRFIFEDDFGKLWIGTWSYGLNRFDPTLSGKAIFAHFRHDAADAQSLSSDNVWDGVRDKNGMLWFATFGSGLNRYDPQTGIFNHYRHKDNDPNSLFQDYVADILIDSFGMIWLCDGVLTRFNPNDGTFVHIKFSQNQTDWRGSYMPEVLYEDKSHILWVGTKGHGIYKIDLKPKRFKHYVKNAGVPNSLNDNEIRIIHEDAAANIWIATRNSGLCRFDPEEETFIRFKCVPDDPKTISNDIVISLLDDQNGYLWVGTVGGLNRINPENNQVIRLVKNSGSQSGLTKEIAVNTMYEDRSGTIWIGTYSKGLFRYDPRSRHFKQFMIDTSAEAIPRRLNDIQYIYEDRSGNLWVSSWTAQYFFDRQKESFVPHVLVADDETNLYFNSPFEDRWGNIWGASMGLNTVDLTTKKMQRYRAFQNPSHSTGFDFANNHPHSILKDTTGALWLGTSMGLHKFDPRARKYIAHYYEKDGLLSNYVLKVVTDNLGKFWILTGKGISIFDEKNPHGSQFRKLDAREGVFNTPSSAQAFMESENGDIYWGGTNGIYRFLSNVRSSNPYIPPVQLTDFNIFDKSTKLDSAVSEIKTIHLKHNENFFSLTFAALDFTNPNQNQYVYKLEGFDRNWVKSGNRNQASYTNVPSGGYIFRVKGSNNEGVWNEEGISVRIIIMPPYWATWWFRLLVSTVVLSLVFSFLRYRRARRREMEQTRYRIARDLHDDVSSSLSSIALTTELMQKDETTSRNEKRLLTRIKNSSRKLIESMDEIVWAVNPEYDQLDNLLLRMKDFATETFDKSTIKYSLSFPEQECLQSCQMGFRRNLFLIYKELLHNIVKHADASQVNISLKKLHHDITLEVTDNGTGFDWTSAKNGIGLKSLRLRTEDLGGHLEFESSAGAGTEVKLTVKIP